MKKTILSSILVCAMASSLSANYILKPSEMINAYTNVAGKTNIKFDLIKHLNPDDSFKWHYARYYDGKHKDDLYFRDLNVNKDKILASGSYHSSLLVFNLKDGSINYNDFHSIKDADHGKLGVKYAEAEDDANKSEAKKKEDKNNSDEWSGASELFVEQGEWINNNTAFVNTMPKYLGANVEEARPYLHQSGIHKVEFVRDDDIKELAFAKGKFFLFRKLSDGGVIALGENNKFSIFDKDLKLKKEFKIDNVVKADVAKDKLFVLLKGEKKGIYEYDLKKDQLKKIADFKAQYYGRPIKVATSPFLVSPDAHYIYYATPHNYNSQLCKVAVKNGKTECGDSGFRLFEGSYAISPNGKLLAYTAGKYKGQTNIYNLENKPYLAGYVTGGVTSYATTFIDNKTLVVSNNQRDLDIYKLEKDGEISIEKRFDDLADKIFNFVSPNMNKITFKIKESNGKKKIKTSLNLPQHINGVNLTWILPDEFKEFVNDKNKVIALPSKDYTGTISVILQLQKDGKIIKEKQVSSPFKIVVKK